MYHRSPEGTWRGDPKRQSTVDPQTQAASGWSWSSQIAAVGVGLTGDLGCVCCARIADDGHADQRYLLRTPRQYQVHRYLYLIAPPLIWGSDFGCIGGGRTLLLIDAGRLPSSGTVNTGVGGTARRVGVRASASREPKQRYVSGPLRGRPERRSRGPECVPLDCH